MATSFKIIFDAYCKLTATRIELQDNWICDQSLLRLLDAHNQTLKNCCSGRKHSTWRSRRRGEERGGGGEEGVAEGGAHDERPRNNQPHQLDSIRGVQGEDYDSNTTTFVGE